MQTTTERAAVARDEVTVVDDRVGGLKRQNRWLRWTSAVLAIAVIALGAWLFFGNDSGSGDLDLTPEQEQMLETINAQLAAWNDGDGAGVVALMASESSYHDNGSRRIAVADGALEDFVNGLGSLSFSVRSLATEGEAAFVGNYVMTTDFVPADSQTPRPSIYRMTPDGSAVVWHYAP